MIVLDSSALIAFLRREPGHEVVASRWSEVCISTVNLSEVLARMSREGASPSALSQQLAGLGLVAIEFNVAQAVLAGEIREKARKFGVGLGDCCCLALALHRTLPILSADRPWLKLGLAIQISLIR